MIISKTLVINPIIISSFVLGVLLSYLAYQLTLNQENKEIIAAINATKQLYKTAFTRELELNQEILKDIRKFYQSSNNVTRQEFHKFTAETIKNTSTINALEWIPRVSQTEKNTYIKQARDNGISEFSITQRDPQGKMVPVKENKAYYYPAFYIEPMKDNEQALGFDLSSSPARNKTIIDSMRSGQTLSTSPIQLVQEQEKLAAYLFFEPIYKTDSTTLKARLENLQGFALGVFHIQALFFSSLESYGLYNKALLVKMEDITEPNLPILLFDSFDTFDQPPKINDGLYQQKVTIAKLGRKWQLSIFPTPAFIRQHQDNSPQIIFSSGMAFTLLVGSFLYLLLGRERAVRLQVKQRTQQLRAEQRRSQIILDTTLNAIITIDENGLIKSFNPAAEHLFGYRQNQVLEQNVKMLMPESYARHHDQYLERYLNSNQAKIIGMGREVTGLKNDGTNFPMFLAVDKANFGSDFIFVGVIVDLSQQKENEKILINAKDKAEKHSRAKSEFLSMMSHELRTPLTVILGYLPLLANKNKLPSSEMIADIANDMQNSGEHLLVLINDILDISKIEAGKLEIKRQWQNSHDVITDCLSSLEKKAINKNIQLINNVPDLDVFSDPTRIKQIFINLVGNAIKFTDKGTITVRGEQSDNSIIFEVQDTGCGIEKHILPLLFDKFYQVDSTSTRKVRGSGLGLAITKLLIELHGGSISVVSQLGVGSTFTFSINNMTEKKYELNSTG